MKEKVVIVTGASAGIGKATAIALGQRKAHVVLAARREDRLAEVAKQIEADGGKALIVPTDVSEESQAQRLIAKAVERFGRIDVLINNAGSGLYATVEETTSEQMERMWKTNFMSTFYCIRSVLPVMKKQGSGHIITISSMSGKRGAPMKGAYSVTKFAQAGFMDTLRRELSGNGIRCTAIYPGTTRTEFLEAIENPFKREIRNRGPVQDPKDVAEAIVEAIEHPKAEVITQRFGRLLAMLNAFSPSLVDWLVDRKEKT